VVKAAPEKLTKMARVARSAVTITLQAAGGESSKSGVWNPYTELEVGHAAHAEVDMMRCHVIDVRCVSMQDAIAAATSTSS
jgi:hypothetical protein